MRRGRRFTGLAIPERYGMAVSVTTRRTGAVLQTAACLVPGRGEDRPRHTLTNLTVRAGIGGDPALGLARLLGKHPRDRLPAGRAGGRA